MLTPQQHKTIARYERLLKDCRNNLRQALQAIESGEMCGGDV